MRQFTYLNVILTVNAALLAGLLWKGISERPLLAEVAAAQSTTSPAPSITVPNAADQRQKMIDALRDIKLSVDGMKKLMETGKLKVEISNTEQMRKVEVTNLTNTAKGK
jgi:hypothetical protein